MNGLKPENHTVTKLSIVYHGLKNDFIYVYDNKPINKAKLITFAQSVTSEKKYTHLKDIHQNIYLGDIIDAEIVSGDFCIISLTNMIGKNIESSFTPAIEFPDSDCVTFEEFSDVMEKASNAIDTALEKDKKVLVHCQYGCNRSAFAIMWWYLQRYGEEKLTFQQVFDYIFEVRSKDTSSTPLSNAIFLQYMETKFIK